MNKPLVDRIPFGKIVTVLAACFGVGLGLCGVNFFISSHSIGESGRAFGVRALFAFSSLLVLLSFLGLTIVLLVWAVLAIAGNLKQSENESQGLFEKSDETKRDDHRGGT